MLRLRVQIPLKGWLLVSCMLCVVLSAGLCDSSSLVQRSPTGCVCVCVCVCIGTSTKRSRSDLGCSGIEIKNGFSSFLSLATKFILSVICLTTGPAPLPKRFRLIVWSTASSFECEYPLLSLRSSSSYLRLLPRLLSHKIWPVYSYPEKVPNLATPSSKTPQNFMFSLPDNSQNLIQHSLSSDARTFSMPVTELRC